MDLLRYVILLIYVGMFLGEIPQIHAQNGYRIGSTQKFQVSGTSTLHDWDMVSEGASGHASITIDGNLIKEIQSLRVELPVNTLKSGNSRMDRIAYDAIDADKHNRVFFELTGVRNITPQMIVATGTLTVSGTTRPVTISTKYRVNGRSIQFIGNQSIKFSQFDVSPPRALMGTIRTGDDLEISFDVDFEPA